MMMEVDKQILGCFMKLRISGILVFVFMGHARLGASQLPFINQGGSRAPFQSPLNQGAGRKPSGASQFDNLKKAALEEQNITRFERHIDTFFIRFPNQVQPFFADLIRQGDMALYAEKMDLLVRRLAANPKAETNDIAIALREQFQGDLSIENFCNTVQKKIGVNVVMEAVPAVSSQSSPQPSRPNEKAEQKKPAIDNDFEQEWSDKSEESDDSATSNDAETSAAAASNTVPVQQPPIQVPDKPGKLTLDRDNCLLSFVSSHKSRIEKQKLENTKEMQAQYLEEKEALINENESVEKLKRDLAELEDSDEKASLLKRQIEDASDNILILNSSLKRLGGELTKKGIKLPELPRKPAAQISVSAPPSNSDRTKASSMLARENELDEDAMLESKAKEKADHEAEQGRHQAEQARMAEQARLAAQQENADRAAAQARNAAEQARKAEQARLAKKKEDENRISSKTQGSEPAISQKLTKTILAGGVLSAVAWIVHKNKKGILSIPAKLFGARKNDSTVFRSKPLGNDALQEDEISQETADESTTQNVN